MIIINTVGYMDLPWTWIYSASFFLLCRARYFLFFADNGIVVSNNNESIKLAVFIEILSIIFTVIAFTAMQQTEKL